jgi:hypothetical protein
MGVSPRYTLRKQKGGLRAPSARRSVRSRLITRGLSNIFSGIKAAITQRTTRQQQTRVQSRVSAALNVADIRFVQNVAASNSLRNKAASERVKNLSKQLIERDVMDATLQGEFANAMATGMEIKASEGIKQEDAAVKAAVAQQTAEAAMISLQRKAQQRSTDLYSARLQVLQGRSQAEKTQLLAQKQAETAQLVRSFSIALYEQAAENAQMDRAKIQQNIVLINRLFRANDPSAVAVLFNNSVVNVNASMSRIFTGLFSDGLRLQQSVAQASSLFTTIQVLSTKINNLLKTITAMKLNETVDLAISQASALARMERILGGLQSDLASLGQQLQNPPTVDPAGVFSNLTGIQRGVNTAIAGFKTAMETESSIFSGAKLAVSQAEKARIDNLKAQTVAITKSSQLLSSNIGILAGIVQGLGLKMNAAGMALGTMAGKTSGFNTLVSGLSSALSYALNLAGSGLNALIASESAFFTTFFTPAFLANQRAGNAVSTEIGANSDLMLENTPSGAPVAPSKPADLTTAENGVDSTPGNISASEGRVDAALAVQTATDTAKGTSETVNNAALAGVNNSGPVDSSDLSAFKSKVQSALANINLAAGPLSQLQNLEKTFLAGMMDTTGLRILKAMYQLFQDSNRAKMLVQQRINGNSKISNNTLKGIAQLLQQRQEVLEQLNQSLKGLDPTLAANTRMLIQLFVAQQQQQQTEGAVNLADGSLAGITQSFPGLESGVANASSDLQLANEISANLMKLIVQLRLSQGKSQTTLGSILTNLGLQEQGLSMSLFSGKEASDMKLNEASEARIQAELAKISAARAALEAKLNASAALAGLEQTSKPPLTVGDALANAEKNAAALEAQFLAAQSQDIATESALKTASDNLSKATGIANGLGENLKGLSDGLFAKMDLAQDLAAFIKGKTDKINQQEAATRQKALAKFTVDANIALRKEANANKVNSSNPSFVARAQTIAGLIFGLNKAESQKANLQQPLPTQSRAYFSFLLDKMQAIMKEKGLQASNLDMASSQLYNILMGVNLYQTSENMNALQQVLLYFSNQLGAAKGSLEVQQQMVQKLELLVQLFSNYSAEVANRILQKSMQSGMKSFFAALQAAMKAESALENSGVATATSQIAAANTNMTAALNLITGLQESIRSQIASRADLSQKMQDALNNREGVNQKLALNLAGLMENIMTKMSQLMAVIAGLRLMESGLQQQIRVNESLLLNESLDPSLQQQIRADIMVLQQQLVQVRAELQQKMDQMVALKQQLAGLQQRLQAMINMNQHIQSRYTSKLNVDVPIIGDFGFGVAAAAAVGIGLAAFMPSSDKGVLGPSSGDDCSKGRAKGEFDGEAAGFSAGLVAARSVFSGIPPVGIPRSETGPSGDTGDSGDTGTDISGIYTEDSVRDATNATDGPRGRNENPHIVYLGGGLNGPNAPMKGGDDSNDPGPADRNTSEQNSKDPDADADADADGATGADSNEENNAANSSIPTPSQIGDTTLDPSTIIVPTQLGSYEYNRCYAESYRAAYAIGWQRAIDSQTSQNPLPITGEEIQEEADGEGEEGEEGAPNNEATGEINEIEEDEEGEEQEGGDNHSVYPTPDDYLTETEELVEPNPGDADTSR